MSDRQTDPDETVTALARLERGDTATLVTDARSITATVTATRWHTDGVTVTFDDRESDRRLRVHTERYDGWLDPLVDAYAPETEFTFDLDDPDSLRPVGSLVDVRLVAAADDQPTRRGRP